MAIKSLQLNSGEVVFREGDDSSEAFRIISGSVKISLNTERGPQVVSHLHKGEIFGEMGMVDALPRSASATAFEQTVLEIITMESFFDYIGSDEALRSDYLRSLFNRLRDSCSKLRTAFGIEASSEYMGRDDQTLNEVLGASLGGEKISHQKQKLQLVSILPGCDPTEVIIDRFPFRIGRSSGSNDLCVQDKKPYYVSRNHCCIQEKSGHFFVKDLGSKVGTVVNGKRITKEPPHTSEELVHGENTVILGRDGSPHLFRVIIS